MRVKNLAILGSTGSVGKNSLEVVQRFPNYFNVSVLSGHKNLKLLIKQIEQFHPDVVILSDDSIFMELSVILKNSSTQLYKGFDELKEILITKKIELLVNALPSIHGQEASLKTLECGIDLALANKESLLLNGPELLKSARENKAQIIPIDSEASAIHQCLMGEESRDVERIYLTASGGPIYQKGLNIQVVKREEILDHPVWKMGEKISVDSASMMNKAFEAYEIHQLFNIPLEKITVILHPEAHVHSMIQFRDGQIKLLASVPDMRIPIAHALFFPERCPEQIADKDPFPATWNFKELSQTEFPCYHMALKYLKKEGPYPAALLIVNDYFVRFFLEGKMAFVHLCVSIDRVMSGLSSTNFESINSQAEFVKVCEERCRMSL